MGIFLIAARHGETDYNARDCLLGQLDPPLNERGREHAHDLAHRLSGQPFAAIYSSPLARSRETAEIISGGKNAIMFDDRLKEVDFGRLDGMTIAEARLAGIYQERERDRMDFRPEGGETYRELLGRVEEFFTANRILENEGPLLIVSHQGTTRMIAARLGLMTPEVAAAMKFRHESLLIAERMADGRIEGRIED